MEERESGPCGDHAKKWRACLKTADYTPDRELGECDDSRHDFYSCIREYRKSSGNVPDTSEISGIPKNCESANLEFHTCMKINSFNVDLCQKRMEDLRNCFHKNAKN